ncbi:hypothetical protein J4461_00475 [Candidatus Pacearchaeota archaeon]|nr:hypothetical protein [Candidatus Pacearchaeota archaeon]
MINRRFNSCMAATGALVALLSTGCETPYNPNWRSDPNDAGAQILNMLPIFGTAMQVDGIRRGNVAEAVIGQNAFQYGVSQAGRSEVNVNVGQTVTETENSQNEDCTQTSEFYTLPGVYNDSNKAPWRIPGVNLKQTRICSKDETITFVGLVGCKAISKEVNFYLFNERGTIIASVISQLQPVLLNDRRYYTVNTKDWPSGDYTGAWFIKGSDISTEPLGTTKIRIVEKNIERKVEPANSNNAPLGEIVHKEITAPSFNYDIK